MDKMSGNSKKILGKITAFLLVLSFACQLCSCTVDNSGFDGVRFTETRHISVLTDSLVPVRTSASVNSSDLAKYIHDQVLAECNVDVSFVRSSDLNINMAKVPDISYGSDINTINTYYKMESIINIKPYLDNYGSSLGNLTGLLGEENIYSCTDDASEVWYLTAKKTVPNSRVTFIRADWLEALGLEAPKTKDELHACLVAFRDNADLLLGDEADNMIPFMVDNNPNVSAKPLFDSFLDTSIGDKEFYTHGYCRATQEGYSEGLKLLNEWYLEELIPSDFESIRPMSKESYEPVEKGYVGAFCAKSDYLFEGGEDSLISTLHQTKGEAADYIAVNTFENKNGEYTSWQEDYLNETGRKIYMPSTCRDPLACLVYLNWISDPDNIKAVSELNITDPYTAEHYLLTCEDRYFADKSSMDPDEIDAISVAEEVSVISRGNKCVRYGPYHFKYVNSDTDFAAIYPDSTRIFVCGVISSAEGSFDSKYEELFDTYGRSGSYVLFRIRNDEWEKVMVKGDLKPW